jgi:GntR family transcriptional regulator/MocR family aminotransferase
MVVSELSKTSASIAHCTPAHQFPTGSVMSADRRRELYAWAHTEDNQQRRYIIEDDYDSEFRMRGRPIPPLYAHDAHESVIYLNTFTRSLGGVFRIAYMVLPAHLVPLFKERFAARSCTVGALEQLELARFIDSGNYERHVNRQRTIYRRLQDSLIARLSESPAHAYVKFRNVDAGLHFLMDVDFSSLQENGLEIEHSCAQTPGATDLFDLLEQRALAAGMRLAHIDDYRFEAALLHVGKAKASQQEKRATQTRTYVMNLSGLDANRADEIGQALARAIESLVK